MRTLRTYQSRRGRPRSYNDFAWSIPRTGWVAGEGPWAVLSCAAPHRSVTLYTSREAAEAARADLCCGQGFCVQPRDGHELVRIAPPEEWRSSRG